jgi:hypothetical protein
MAEKNATKPVATTATMTKSPIEALSKSVIPGWGQLYVESYWKAPIFFAGAAFCVGGAIVQGSQLQRTEAQYAALDSVQRIFRMGLYVRQREFFRDTRDAFIIASVAVWALAAIDAFVGAHLYDFDVSDEIPKAEQKSSSYAPEKQYLEKKFLENNSFRLTPYLDPVNMRVGIAARW